MAQTSRSSPAIGGAVPTHSLSIEQYSEVVNGRVDCCCIAAHCEYDPSTLTDIQKGELT